jgi:16S rRNA (uracil1498-N3)-methyltransferase
MPARSLPSRPKQFFVAAPLAVGQVVALPAPLQHRLTKVLRLTTGAIIHLANGQHGIMVAEINHPKAHTARIVAEHQPLPATPPLTLALGLPKRDAWEAALRQATELGITHLQPLTTAFSQVDKLNLTRAQLLLTEAAEQTERPTLPTLLPLQTLPQWLAQLTGPVAWAYERYTGPATTPTASTLLIGPEGGFSPIEIAQLQAHPHLQAFSLGRTILRTDTAVVSGLTLLRQRS